MRREWVATIAKYFDDLESNDLSIKDFCFGYESWWNDRRPHAPHIYDGEKEALQAVFDVVVVFSSDEDELKRIPLYKSESDVRAAVNIAQKTLQDCGAA